ncbi:hypothetical protein LY78DRAFT_216053 [Colletotrichum sublineola]|nr:hypothetical protein LY78DRAFT_216053 [Colletotrichum sublineola]
MLETIVHRGSRAVIPVSRHETRLGRGSIQARAWRLRHCPSRSGRGRTAEGLDKWLRLPRPGQKLNSLLCSFEETMLDLEKNKRAARSNGSGCFTPQSSCIIGPTLATLEIWGWVVWGRREREVRVEEGGKAGVFGAVNSREGLGWLGILEKKE